MEEHNTMRKYPVPSRSGVKTHWGREGTYPEFVHPLELFGMKLVTLQYIAPPPLPESELAAVWLCYFTW